MSDTWRDSSTWSLEYSPINLFFVFYKSFWILRTSSWNFLSCLQDFTYGCTLNHMWLYTYSWDGLNVLPDCHVFTFDVDDDDDEESDRLLRSEFIGDVYYFLVSCLQDCKVLIPWGSACKLIMLLNFNGCTFFSTMYRGIPSSKPYIKRQLAFSF